MPEEFLIGVALFLLLGPVVAMLWMKWVTFLIDRFWP